MNSFLKADIFFFIASIATIVIGVLLFIALVYIIKVGKNLYTISETIKKNVIESHEFIGGLKNQLENNFVFQYFFPRARRKKQAEEKGETQNKN